MIHMVIWASRRTMGARKKRRGMGARGGIASRLRGVLEAGGVRLECAAPREYVRMGLGLAATTPLPPHALALEVPPAVWRPLSASHAAEQLHERSSGCVARASAVVRGSTSALDAALLSAHLALSPPGSSVATMIGDLAPDVPLLWPPPLRRALLHGTSCSLAVESQDQLASLLCDALSDLAACSPSEDGALGGGDFYGAFRIAQAVLLSRAHAGQGKPLALVPGLDLLNHAGPSANAEVVLDSQNDAFQLLTTREVLAGEQLTIDYGALPSHKFLRLYGFLPDICPIEGSHTMPRKDEEVVLHLLPAGAPGAAEAGKALRASGLPTRVPLRWDVPRGAQHADAASESNSEPDSSSAVALPFDGLALSERSAAVHVLTRAVIEQQTRLSEGREACEVIRGASSKLGEKAANRAELCLQLNRREMTLLEAARVQLMGQSDG